MRRIYAFSKCLNAPIDISQPDRMLIKLCLDAIRQYLGTLYQGLDFKQLIFGGLR